MADHCVFFDDLLDVRAAIQRTYAILQRPEVGLACLDVAARSGPDWLFARRWVRTAGGERELFRFIDQLDRLGFRFRVRVAPHGATPPAPTPDLDGDAQPPRRASQLHTALSLEEQRIHAELFPEEACLLARGYDWDADHAFRNGAALPLDGFGRVLDRDGDVLYEWVNVPEECTWRRYPLERCRPVAMEPRPSAAPS